MRYLLPALLVFAIACKGKEKDMEANDQLATKKQVLQILSKEEARLKAEKRQYPDSAAVGKMYTFVLQRKKVILEEIAALQNSQN